MGDDLLKWVQLVMVLLVPQSNKTCANMLTIEEIDERYPGTFQKKIYVSPIIFQLEADCDGKF